MGREVEYRRYAAALLDLAKRAGDAADKCRLLVMADGWLKLADKTARLRWHKYPARHPQAGRAAGQDQPTVE